MPAVSTTTRPNRRERRKATAAPSVALVATFCRRVANERMNVRSLRSELIRIRSPRRAPPVRRRVGSTATIAISSCGNHSSSRATISSVTVLLPAPPVPVIPTTGVAAPAASQAAS